MPNVSDKELEDILSSKPTEYRVSDEELDNFLSEQQERKPLSETISEYGLKGLGAIGKGIEKVESYTSAPVRAGIYAAQTGKPVFETIGKQFGEDPSTAPTGQMIAREAGLSEEKYIPTPFIKDPWGKTKEEKYLSLSPSQIAGAGINVATDPLTYVGELAALKGIPKAAEGVAGGLSKTARGLEEFAGKRAAKASLGSNLAAQRELAGITKEGIPQIGKVKSRYADLAKKLLEKGEEEYQGKPIGKVVGWLTKTEQAGEKAANKFDYWSNYYNKFKDYVDTINPNAVSGKDIADELMKYAETMPVTESTKSIKNRLYQEAENILANYKEMSMEDAIKLKSQFQFRREAPDAFTSSRDVNNKIRNIIDDKIMSGIEKSLNTHYPDGTKLSDYAPEVLSEYKKMKESYGLYKKLSSTATEREVRDISNRALSPSDYGVGGAALISATASTGKLGANEMIVAMTATALNHLGREYGSSIAANAAYGLAKAAERGSKVVLKYNNILKNAFAAGIPIYMATIEALKNKDKEFSKEISK